jgi:hypothetical protein
MKLHITTIQPPNSKSAPEKAHERSEYMSLGVMALWHCSGLAPRGIMKAIYIPVSPASLSLTHSRPYLHAADTQSKANTQIVTVRPFGRKNGV